MRWPILQTERPKIGEYAHRWITPLSALNAGLMEVRWRGALCGSIDLEERVVKISRGGCMVHIVVGFIIHERVIQWGSSVAVFRGDGEVCVCLNVFKCEGRGVLCEEEGKFGNELQRVCQYHMEVWVALVAGAVAENMVVHLPDTT